MKKPSALVAVFAVFAAVAPIPAAAASPSSAAGFVGVSGPSGFSGAGIRRRGRTVATVGSSRGGGGIFQQRSVVPPPVTGAAPRREIPVPWTTAVALGASRNNDDASSGNGDGDPLSRALGAVASSPSRSVAFSALMTFCGAALGPFLDSYHSSFGVLQYDAPIYVPLWGTADHPALITSWWVPPLFGLAGFIIGWLYVLLDAALETSRQEAEAEAEGTTPQISPPRILAGISIFTLQYWLSGVMYSSGFDRAAILGVMSSSAVLGFAVFDGTAAGLITSAATAVGGPLIEVGLISALRGHGGYHYTDAGETGFFPLWIVPVYFLGGPAVGNLARGIWNKLSEDVPSAAEEAAGTRTAGDGPRCTVCNDTRCVGCPNCDALGSYVTYGRSVKCNCCKGRGYVMCRACFDAYGDDPNDIEKIREIMSKMPD